MPNTTLTWNQYLSTNPISDAASELIERVKQLNNDHHIQTEIASLASFSTNPSYEFKVPTQDKLNILDIFKVLESAIPQGVYSTREESTSCDEALNMPHVIMRRLSQYMNGMLAKRVEALQEMAEEESPDSEPLSLSSLQDFVTFLGISSNCIRPNLVLTPEGNISAKWKTDSRNHFVALEFIGDSDVKYVVFAPDPRHPYKTTRAAGKSSIESVMELIKPYQLDEWIVPSVESCA